MVPAVRTEVSLVDRRCADALFRNVLAVNSLFHIFKVRRVENILSDARCLNRRG